MILDGSGHYFFVFLRKFQVDISIKVMEISEKNRIRKRIERLLINLNICIFLSLSLKIKLTS